LCASLSISKRCCSHKASMTSHQAAPALFQPHSHVSPYNASLRSSLPTSHFRSQHIQPRLHTAMGCLHAKPFRSMALHCPDPGATHRVHVVLPAAMQASAQFSRRIYFRRLVNYTSFILQASVTPLQYIEHRTEFRGCISAISLRFRRRVKSAQIRQCRIELHPLRRIAGDAWQARLSSMQPLRRYWPGHPKLVCSAHDITLSLPPTGLIPRSRPERVSSMWTPRLLL
jgi:hypothetical protein